MGVEATGINACPCAQGLVRGRAAERLAEAGYDGDEVDRILDLVPIATHNQRGRGTLLVGTAEELDAEELVTIVEESMSAPVYELLKRPDELFVVEHAHLRPRFVEDSVRVALKGLLDTYAGLSDDDFVLSRQLNLETIHDHDVVAERFGHGRRAAGGARRQPTRAADDARGLARSGQDLLTNRARTALAFVIGRVQAALRPLQRAAPPGEAPALRRARPEAERRVRRRLRARTAQRGTALRRR